MNEDSITYIVSKNNDIIFDAKSGVALGGFSTTVDILYI